MRRGRAGCTVPEPLLPATRGGEAPSHEAQVA